MTHQLVAAVFGLLAAPFAIRTIIRTAGPAGTTERTTR